MSQAVDYSFSRPNPADLAAAGYVGALRYLAPLPNTKVVTGDEIASLHKNGLAIGFVWESGASRAGQGESAGRADGYAANDQADALGVPDSVTIYFAVDYDANPAAVVDYFRGAKATSKRPVGAYGSFRVVEHLLDQGLIERAWQTVAWSHGQHSARAHLYQRADAAANPPPGCDVNEVLNDDWGQWAPTSSPVPPPHPSEVPMSAQCTTDDGHWHYFGKFGDDLYELVYDGAKFVDPVKFATLVGAHDITASAKGNRIDFTALDPQGQMHHGWRDGGDWAWDLPPGVWA